MNSKITILLIIFFIYFFYFQIFAQNREQADNFFRQADSLYKAGNYPEAAQMFEKSAESEKQCLEPRLEDISFELFNAGLCYYVCGQYGRALKNYKEVLAICQGLKNREGEAKVLVSIADTYIAWNNFENADGSYIKAITIYEGLGKKNEIAEIYNKQGDALKAARKYNEAKEYYKKAINIFTSTDNISGVAASKYKTGELFKELFNLDKALEYCSEALELFIESGERGEIANVKNFIGSMYDGQGNYSEALKYYSEAFDLFKDIPDYNGVASALNNIGGIYHSIGNYNEALNAYNQALDIYKQTENDKFIASLLNNIGSVHYSLGDYDQTFALYTNSLEIYNRIRDKESVATTYNNIGMFYNSLGQFDKAIEYYNQAISIYDASGNIISKAITLNNIGGVYNSWGRFDNAMFYFDQALDIQKKYGDKSEIARMLNNTGGVYESWGEYDKAMENYAQSLNIYRESGEKSQMATVLNNIGKINNVWGYFDVALQNYNSAMDIYNELGEKSRIAATLNNIAGIYNITQQYDIAINKYSGSLKIRRNLGEKKGIALTLYNISTAYIVMGQYKKAIEYLSESVEILEKLRKTASGDIRRDYLASQIHAYQSLILCHIKEKDQSKAFYYNELCRAKLLTERLSRSDTYLNIPDLEDVREEMSENTAIIIYATIDNPVLSQIFFSNKRYDFNLIEKDSVFHVFMKDLDIRSRIISRLSKAQIRKLKLYLFSDNDVYIDNRLKNLFFEVIIESYNGMLTDPVYEEKAKKIARLLYDFLILPMEGIIKEKNEIIIMPDGILGILPFETLIDRKGNYLVDNYNISYVNSLSVQRLIKDRQYPLSRKPLIAFGISDYFKPSKRSKLVRIDKIENIRNEAMMAISENTSLKRIYAQIGYKNFNDLEGSLEEINSIREIVPGAVVYINNDASESKIKELSENGELANYKMIHFSTHGITIPDLPELSSLVMYQFDNEKNGQDGFLRMGEIANLRIKADFVNLSACETGLGKVYSGEGVVGLTQSFLIAGANGLSVSLWQVDEESTAVFMKEVYRLALEEGMNYYEAINEVKRKFIRGEMNLFWRSPYFWGPFVYYGKKN